MYFYHRTDDRGNPLVSCPATPSTSRSLPLFVLLSLSYQLIPPCVEQLRSLKLIENKIIFGCTKKREIYQRRVCVALKSGTKIELEKKKKSHIPGCFLLHKWFRTGILSVTIRHFCNCSIPDLCLGCRKKWHRSILHRKHTYTICDLLTKIRHKWPGLWRSKAMWLRTKELWL